MTDPEPALVADLREQLAGSTGALLLATLEVAGPVTIPLALLDQLDAAPPDLNVVVDLGAGLVTLRAVRPAPLERPTP